MLFDLRGAGRRRTVQAIYLTLAILMGGGLVLFGIGGNVSGGLLDALNGGGGGGGGNPFKDDVKVAERRVRTAPSDPAAWAALARVRFNVASIGGNFERTADGAARYTGEGKAELRRAVQAWDRYLALEPKRPDDGLAARMLQAFGPIGLNQPARAAEAAELITEVRPTASTFFQLAVYAYQAGQTRKGDLAADRAISLSPKDERESLRERLKEAKGAGASGAGQQSGTGATANVPSG
jgi:hypothetical protein